MLHDFAFRPLIRRACLGILLALLTGRGALAAPVSGDTAANAVKGWLRLDRKPMGRNMSANVKTTETVRDAAGAALYHVIHLDPAGYAIVPADDTVEPVIAFSAGGRFDSSSGDPAVALVSRDLPRRVARARTGAADAKATRAHRKWHSLLLASSPNPPPDSEMNGVIVIASQVWVAPFVQTLWNQQTDVSGQYACFNYYTPPYGAGNVNNYYCGCVATCMAQLMFYYQYPNTAVGTASFPITVNGSGTTANLRGGNGNGGPYQWANMPLNPNAPTAIQAQAIGALCSDAAVAVNMDFEADGSAAETFTAQQELASTFKFSNVGYYENDAGGLSGSNLLAMINPNVDARLPVSLAINGVDGGHCLICDGYGYSGSTLFHHLNPGWGGDDDLWYALPNIDTDNGAFTMVQACIYNLYTNGTGLILSGRVTDPTGAPVAGASVTAVRTGGGTYAATTDTNGIYALVRIPANSQFALSVTNTGDLSASGNYSTGVSNYDSPSSGNFWGANFILSPPLLAIPETGFAAVGPVGGPFSLAAQSFVLTNTTASAVTWTLANTSSWLSATSTNGSVAAGAASHLTISLNAAAGSLAAGSYSATVWVTNLNTHLAQGLAFSLSVKTADYPISVTGFNADVVVENAATGGNSLLYAQAFETNNVFEGNVPFCFYESGLVATNAYGGAVVKGLPASGMFISETDNQTAFQFGPYTSNNVLYLVSTTNTGSLTLNSAAAYKSLSVLAASAEGGGNGSLIVHFADGSASSAIPFSASNYFTTNGVGALTNFGLLLATGPYNEFYAYDYQYFYPTLYQTSINLQTLGLHTKPIASVTFTMAGGPNTSASTVTGIFALSGTESPFPVISSQPQSVAIASGGNATLSVAVTGAATLGCQWYLNGAKLAGAQSNPLNLTNAGVANAGSYQVVVTNGSGSVTSSVALLTLTNVPVSFLANTLQLSGGKLTLQLTNLTGQGQVVIAASTNLLQWVPVFTNPSAFGAFTFTDSAAGTFPHRYYRATTP